MKALTIIYVLCSAALVALVVQNDSLTALVAFAWVIGIIVLALMGVHEILKCISNAWDKANEPPTQEQIDAYRKAAEAKRNAQLADAEQKRKIRDAKLVIERAFATNIPNADAPTVAERKAAEKFLDEAAAKANDYAVNVNDVDVVDAQSCIVFGRKSTYFDSEEWVIFGRYESPDYARTGCAKAMGANRDWEFRVGEPA